MNGSISELLPEPILHHVLSLLSQKEAVRTCVLSKSWRHLWCGRPEISFRRSDFRGECLNSPEGDACCQCCFQEKKNIFRLTLEKTFQRYHHQKLSIENIELDMFEVDSQLISLLEMWIPILIPNTSLKTLILCFSPLSSTNFDLPWVVFQVKSLKKLCLERCNIVNPTGNNNKVLLLECLQTLSLKNVFVEVDTLEMLVSSCPLIENAVVESCVGLRGPKVIIRIKHNNLKHLSFNAHVEDSDDDSPTIEIDAPNLISLSLLEVQLHANNFKNLSSNFPCLEDLSVLFCKVHGELKLSSRSIRRLTLSVSSEPIKATIDAPNLHDFEFTGELPVKSLTFAPTSSEWKSHLVVLCLEAFDANDDDDDLPWFPCLGELLRSLSESQISLDFSFENLPPNMEVEEEEGGGFNDEPVVVENLRLFLSCLEEVHAESILSLPHFFNGLFSVCRPRYTQTIDNDNQLFDFLCEVLVQEREKRDYFWQKYLEEVGLEVWGKETNQWNPTSLQPDCELPSKQNVRFRLSWRDW